MCSALGMPTKLSTTVEGFGVDDVDLAGREVGRIDARQRSRRRGAEVFRPGFGIDVLWVDERRHRQIGRRQAGEIRIDRGQASEIRVGGSPAREMRIGRPPAEEMRIGRSPAEEIPRPVSIGGARRVSVGHERHEIVGRPLDLGWGMAKRRTRLDAAAIARNRQRARTLGKRSRPYRRKQRKGRGACQRTRNTHDPSFQPRPYGGRGLVRTGIMMGHE